VEIGVALTSAIDTEPFSTILLFFWLVSAAVLTSGFWLVPVALSSRTFAGAAARLVCGLSHAALASIFVLILGVELREVLQGGFLSAGACLVGLSGCAMCGYIVYRICAFEAQTPVWHDSTPALEQTRVRPDQALWSSGLRQQGRGQSGAAVGAHSRHAAGRMERSAA
jgi:hypothetical protein